MSLPWGFLLPEGPGSSVRRAGQEGETWVSGASSSRAAREGEHRPWSLAATNLAVSCLVGQGHRRAGRSARQRLFFVNGDVLALLSTSLL